MGSGSMCAGICGAGDIIRGAGDDICNIGDWGVPCLMGENDVRCAELGGKEECGLLKL
jgi:hypothetical protein